MPGGCDDKMTLVSIPFSSMICCTMCPGGTCIGIGSGGPLLDTIRTVAGPAQRISCCSIWIFNFRGEQVKLWGPLRTRAIPERLRRVFTHGQVPPLEFGAEGTLMQIVPPPQILSYKYKNERSVAFKIRQNPFSAGAPPRTPLGELRTLPQTS